MSSRKRIYIYENGKKIPFDSANLELIFKKLALFGDSSNSPEISATEISSGVWGIDCGGAVLRNVGSAQGDTDVVTKSTSGMPAGMISPFGGTEAPDGWLPCDGRAVSRATYANLFSAIGVVWGAGNGSTTFNIPNLAGKFLRGVGGNSAALGVPQGQATAKNQLTLSGGVTALATTSRSLASGSAAAQKLRRSGALNVGGGSTTLYALQSDGTTYASGFSQASAVTGTTDIAHSHGNSFQIDSTATETRPDNVAVNYIIKT